MKNYQAMLVESHIYQSISRKENCYDNPPIENFFSILEREFYDGYVYRSRKELKKAIEELQDITIKIEFKKIRRS